MIRYLVGALIGGNIGYFVFYKLIGCSNGRCPITANPYISTVYGIILGVLLVASPPARTVNLGDSIQHPAIEYKKITSEEAKDRINSGDEIVILDVRTEDEYNSRHIPNAILIPN